jgi:glycosyltransferase involved in cell wall biosynthesis
MIKNPAKKILFFCFGFSIHAQRRITIFAEDPRFEVFLVSNFNYEIPNTSLIHLNSNTFNPIHFRENLILGLAISILRFLIYLFNKISSRRCKILKEILSVLKDFCFIKIKLKKFKPDLIFLQTLLYPSYISYLFPKKIPFVITFWNGDVLWWASYTGIERKFKRKIVIYGSKRARLITVNSETALNACLSYNIEREKIYKISYPAIDLNLFKPIEKTVSKRRLNLTHKNVILCPRGFHGFTDYLNNDVIINAFLKVNKRLPDTLLLFINGWDNETWNDYLYKSFPIKKENVMCISQVNWNDMPYYYSSADLILSLSSNDSLPNTMLEAMACKIPVIMSDIPQIREWITDEVNGMLCNVQDSEMLYNKIITLLENSDNCVERFVDYNYNLIVKNFDSRNNIQKIKELILSVE